MRVPVVLAFAALAAAPAPAGSAEGRPDAFALSVGRRGAVMGYPDAGLEVWAWPLQIVSGLDVTFVSPGRLAPLEGRALLRRIETTPEGPVRVYVGPDFTVRERLLMAPDAPAAVLAYEVAGRAGVRVRVRFRPVLDLQWPGAVGGQERGWDKARGAYLLRVPSEGFSAAVGSPQAVAHDEVGNPARRTDETLALELDPQAAADIPGVRRAELRIVADPVGRAKLGDAPEAASLAAARRVEAADRRATGVEVRTPDPMVDAALADARDALEQAQACAPGIGCGLVAGYGPSRPARRPQYAWFFGGDGLVAAEGLLAAGRPERAREELAFVAKFQDPASGMIWHEMSMSAPRIDWVRRYPYMYVHVDITLQYLATLARHVRTTGDLAFARSQAASVERAWRYARSLVDPRTGLPTIPAGKQGQNEQDVLRDDTRLSSAWIDAADGYAALERALGRADGVREGEAAGSRARRALAAGVWDASAGFWLGGHRADGAPVHDARSDAAGLLRQGVLKAEQARAALDRLTGPDFLTDWGVRSLSRADPAFDPDAYSQGAVWALGTSTAAEAFWRGGRSLAGWSAWRGLVDWNALDAPGRLHEVLAGDLFHPELESVPAQTWSSAGLWLGFTRGLLGLEVDGAAGALRLAPDLPAAWDRVEVRRLPVGATQADVILTRTADALMLEVTRPASAVPMKIDFAPALPLGARLIGVEVDGRPPPASGEDESGAAHEGGVTRARATAMAGGGVTRIAVRFAGGVRIDAPRPTLRLGDASTGVRVSTAAWTGGALTLRAFVHDEAHASVDLLTALTPATVTGGTLTVAGEGRLHLRLTPTGAPDASGYRAATAVVRFGE